MIRKTGPMHTPSQRRAAMLVILLAMSLLVSACGGGTSDSAGGGGKEQDESTFIAQVASYELVAGRPQRFLAGITGQGTGTVVSFGDVSLQFFYLGTQENPVDPPARKASATASFLPIAGREVAPGAEGPREVRPSEGVGVYAARDVEFDTAGLWGVQVKTTIGDRDHTLNASFAVRAEPRVPAPGMPAPRTENPTVATLGLRAPALDSRASSDQDLPDPELHSSSVAAALAEGRPVVVVVSTPVYCVSRFCGPITDSVQRAAAKYGDRATFVHLELWEDFEQKKVNPAAREWAQPGGRGELQEPWVFLVGADGIVRERFDNVVSDAELDTAVRTLVGASAG